MGGQPSAGVGGIGLPVMACVCSPHPHQVLAFFRFSGLLLGYAVLRLRHWWVIAVRHPSAGSRGLGAGVSPGGAGATEGVEEDSLPSPFSLSSPLGRSPHWCPVHSSLSRSSSLRSVAQGLAGLASL